MGRRRPAEAAGSLVTFGFQASCFWSSRRGRQWSWREAGAWRAAASWLLAGSCPWSVERCWSLSGKASNCSWSERRWAFEASRHSSPPVSPPGPGCRERERDRAWSGSLDLVPRSRKTYFSKMGHPETGFFSDQIVGSDPKDLRPEIANISAATGPRVR